MTRFVLAASLAFAASTLFFACSGTTASTSDSDAGGAPSPSDGGTLPGTDAGDATDGSAATPQDAGLDGPTAASCALEGGTQCLMCCAAIDPTAYAAFTALVKTCACSAEVCGPLDAGAAGPSSDASDDASDDVGDGSAADAAVFGVGACASECGAATTATSASPACEGCLRLSLGSTSSPGVCGSVAAQCITIAACAPFFECVLGCQ